MGAGASHGYNSIEEALADGVSHADLLANGVSQADIDFLTWNDGDQRSYRTAKPCRGSRDDVGESKEGASGTALGFVVGLATRLGPTAAWLDAPVFVAGAPPGVPNQQGGGPRPPRAQRHSIVAPSPRSADQVARH